MKVTYSGPHPLVRLVVDGVQVTVEKDASIDVSAEQGKQLADQGWETSTSKPITKKGDA